MKKILFASLLLVAGTGLFWAALAHAATQPAAGGCSAGKCTYVPLEPLPCPPGAPNCQTAEVSFAQYVSAMFRLLITLGSLFAVLMLVIAGIGYMISDSGVDIQKAKDRARTALYGLLLLTACWLILYTINPNLLRFDLFTRTLDTAAQKSTSTNGRAVQNGSGAGSDTTAATPTKITIYAPAHIGDSITLPDASIESKDRAAQFAQTCASAGGKIKDSDGGGTATILTCVAP